MAKDYYEVLGVGRTSTDDEIKKAFRKLAHQHHPDKKTGNDAKFKEINEAYQVLSNKDKRQQYDRFGSTFNNGNQQGFRWQDMNQGGSPFEGFGSFNGQSFDFGDLGDMFSSMFSSGGERSTTRARKGSDIELSVPLTFEESFFGTEKQVTVKIKQHCSRCKGTGDEPSAKYETCKTCNGKGRVTVVQNSFFGAVRAETICTNCSGKGTISSAPCAQCNGNTVETRNTTITIRIPAGIDIGNTLRLSGQGEAGLRGGPSGDIYVKVTIAPHDHFQRDGDLVKSKEYAPLSTMIEGGTIEVRAVSGPVKLKIPAGTLSGTTFELKQKGFERLTGRGRGDHHVTIHVRVPQRINSRQRKALADFESDRS